MEKTCQLCYIPFSPYSTPLSLLPVSDGLFRLLTLGSPTLSVQSFLIFMTKLLSPQVPRLVPHHLLIFRGKFPSPPP